MRISPEKFIASITTQRDSRLFPYQARDEIRRNHGGVGHWFVKLVREDGKQIYACRLSHQLDVFGIEVTGNLSCVNRFVKAAMAGECDREGLDASFCHTRSGSGHQARIDTSTEHNSYRYIRD
jgi:hypothetical protein